MGKEGKEEKPKRYGFGNTPVNCVLKRLGLIEEIKLVDPPGSGFLDDLKPMQKLSDIFHMHCSPIIVYAGDSGKDWLLYLRRYFKKRSPFFLHIGFPSIPVCGWLKGEEKIPPSGHLSLTIPSLLKILNFLARADELMRVNEEERWLIFSLFGWGASFKSKKSIEHIRRINRDTDIIEEIEEKVKEKQLHTWEQIKGEFDLKGSEKDWEKKQKIMQFRGILRIIEGQWKLTSQLKAKKSPG